jgi:hypothetical protein
VAALAVLGTGVFMAACGGEPAKTPVNASEVSGATEKGADPAAKPADPAAATPATTPTMAMDAKPADMKPADAKPADMKPADAKPADAKTTMPAPATTGTAKKPATPPAAAPVKK